MRPATDAFRPLLLVAILALGAHADDRPLGFRDRPDALAAQRKAEARALDVPTPEAARLLLRKLTEEPHVAGTPEDYDTAIFVRDQLRGWGWKADLAEYQVLLNYPDRDFVQFAITKPERIELKVIEDYNPADKDSGSSKVMTAFHGYGVSGTAEGQVVYVNYARNEDFATLEKLGIDVKDKVVLARYGEIFRGLKVYNAQKRGARGVLIYSDPANDGYGKGDVYPDGPYRPGSAIQRGSVEFLSLGAGDPSTPDGPSIDGAPRLPIDPDNGFPRVDRGPGSNQVSLKDDQDRVDAWEKETGRKRNEYFANIPSMPISYDSARPILENLGGPVVPTGWQGGLPLAYHVGPGPVEVSFTLKMDYKIRPIWNVIATLEGSVEPDRWIMVGNHRDAWVYGAVDPSSGTAATMEMCRALGEAVKSGWKPRRTLKYASWDGEEYGLIGSTEWAVHHAKELDEKAVMMLNVDSAVSGPDLELDGVPSMRDLILQAANGVRDTRSNRPLGQIWVEAQRRAWAANSPLAEGEELATGKPDSADKGRFRTGGFRPAMTPLGSGSDYTAFLDHLGIPAVDANFSGKYGVYHSVFDNFYWMEHFGDPEFITHATAARLYTLIAMRAAGADVVPLTFTPYAEAIHSYLGELKRTVVRSRRLATPDDPRPIKALAALGKVQAAADELGEQAVALDAATSALAKGDGADDKQVSKVNDLLTKIERAFLLPDGLPGRPWFKHGIYAPGVTTGYASWPLPAVRQAIEENDGDALAAAVPPLVERLKAATAAMKAAADAAADDDKK
ncbi:M28 family metallopeptidase [Isosphaeraceae bacterium EP7]